MSNQALTFKNVWKILEDKQKILCTLFIVHKSLVVKCMIIIGIFHFNEELSI